MIKLKKLLKEATEEKGDFGETFVNLNAADVEKEVKSVLGDMIVDVRDYNRKDKPVLLKFKNFDEMVKFNKRRDFYSEKIENKLKRKYKLKPSDDLVMAPIVRTNDNELGFLFSYINP